MERFSDSQTWYVCFHPSTSRRWFNLFLNPAFKHILLVREVDGGVLVVNPLEHLLSAKIYPAKLSDCLDGVVLSRTVHYGMIYKPSPLMPISCVTVACRVLGIQKRILTPYGLYKELLNAGANIVNPYNPCANKWEVL